MAAQSFLSPLLQAGLALAGLHRVPADVALTVHRFGRHHRSLGPGWHWLVPGIERVGHAVGLTGHHLHVPGAGARGEAELYYQILEPEKAGAALDAVDDWVAAQARDALAQVSESADQFKTELNRRLGGVGLRVVRCALHPG